MGNNQLNRYNFPNRVYVFTELSEVKFYNHGLLTYPCYEVELTMFPIVFALSSKWAMLYVAFQIETGQTV